MLIIPAIDLKQGKVVRLAQGKPENETIYSTDPVEVALKLEEAGALLIHIVDLDGALSGRQENLGQLKKIIEGIKIPVQFGGGIRSIKQVKDVLDLGVRRVIIGTKAAIDPIFIREAAKQFKEQLVIGIDARDGKVAIWGWQEMTEYSAISLAQEMKQLGIKDVVYTDIARDGMLEGPNFEAITSFAKSTKMRVIASGGVSTIEDVQKIIALAKYGVMGMIIGKALYTNDIDLKEAISLAKNAPLPEMLSQKSLQDKNTVRLYP